MSGSKHAEIPAGLTVSYSGIRGIVGESLTPAVARRFGAAFAAMVAERAARPTLVVARDTRPSGEALLAALLDGLGGEGWRIIDLGIVATPTLQLSLEHFRADGGLIVTASHNPAQWNGFKLFMGCGAPPPSVEMATWSRRGENTVLDQAQTARLLSLVNAGVDVAPGTPCIETAHDEAVNAHVARVLAQVDVEAVRARRFRVALDAGRGAGHDVARLLLEKLGCVVVDVQAERDSEPLPENLGALREAVREAGCDLGLAQDLDADRLALVDETGAPAGEEFTLVLVVDYVLGLRARAAQSSVVDGSLTDGWRVDRRAAVVVKNLSTTRAVDAVVGLHGATLVETRVGEVNLSRALARACAEDRFAFGGEGNGGVIWPAVSFGRDSLVGMGLVLECLARTAGTLSEHLGSLPRYSERKAKMPSPGRDALAPLFARVAGAFDGGRVDEMDGVRVRFDDGSWIGIRPSNTEPVLRLVAESPSAEWAASALERLVAVVASNLNAH